MGGGPGTGKWRAAAWGGGLALTLDLASKAAVRRSLDPWEIRPVIDGCFNLVLAHNTGAAFSFMAGEGGAGQSLKMIALALVSLAPFFYFYFKADPRDKARLFALGLIWGGALGNIHDRLRWGAVVDFLDFYWRGRHWPAFNLADVAICLGAGLLALGLLREKPRNR